MIGEFARLQEVFFNVTGNLINSVAVGMYNNGELIGIATSYEELGKGPTRKTLKKGEAYDLNFYWGNAKAFNRRITKPYIEETGTENYYGHEEAVKFIRSHKPSRREGLSAIIVVAVDYAKYTETAKAANVLTEARNQLLAAGADVSVIKCGG